MNIRISSLFFAASFTDFDFEVIGTSRIWQDEKGLTFDHNSIYDIRIIRTQRETAA